MNELITLHPKLVHFPIALIYVTAFFEILYLVYKKDFYKNTAVWLFYLGLGSAVLAAASGGIAEETLGHDSPNHDKIHIHKTLMQITTGLWLLVGIIGLAAKKMQKTDAVRKYFIAGIIIVLAVLTLGADKGGELVYKYGIGVNEKIIVQPVKSMENHGDHDHAH